MDIDTQKISPMMAQYLETKKQYPDCILFYRIGDFYEMFFDDAKIASEELDLVLTGKDCGLPERAPMCGVPHHAADNYIERLVKKGFKVAVGEQTEDPRLAKGLVKREIVRVVTPGTYMDPDTSGSTGNNYLMSLCDLGLSLIDVGTGEFLVTEVGDRDGIREEFDRFRPSELVVSLSFPDRDLLSFTGLFDNDESEGFSVTHVPEDFFDYNASVKLITDHFGSGLEDLGLSSITSGVRAAGAALKYVYTTQFSEVSYISSIKPYNISEYMILDSTAVRNLELLESLRDKDKKGTLLWVLDKTRTAMGSRFIRKMISQPLLKINAIRLRQDAIEELNDRFIDREEIIEYLRPVYDMERLISRVSSQRANPLDLIALRNSLRMLPDIKAVSGSFSSDLIKDLSDHIDPLRDIYELILNAVDEDAPVSTRDGRIIKNGFDENVDRLRQARAEGHKWILDYEAKERETTGIKTLKIKLNKNFGHCVEVSNSFKNSVPDHYVRRQTLTNGERYTTPELDRLSAEILGAEEKLNILEHDIFTGLTEKISSEAGRIQTSSQSLAYLDALCSLSLVASRNRYVRPSINERGIINIKEGRHPVVELMLKDRAFIANDTKLNTDRDKVAVITGPNMAGKSTYLRQNALITLMAQMGSFVPAKSADISICDRIFTRVGASDDLAGGQSTFMVEMSEVANILKKATSSSLLIMDEIGRGTSTFDGLSIAWAVIEYICDNKKLGAKTLFATHYHELTELEGKIKGVHNYRISVSEKDGELIFLRKILPGGADRSYGIEVAKLAGVPDDVIVRAEEISALLNESDILRIDNKIGSLIDLNADSGEDFNMPVQSPDAKKSRLYKETAEKIKSTDINRLTPMEAFFLLNELKERLDRD